MKPRTVRLFDRIGPILAHATTAIRTSPLPAVVAVHLHDLPRPERKSWLKGQLAEPLARGRVDRIGQRGRGDRRAWFADPTGRFAASHEVHLDRRSLVHSQDPVVVKIR